MNNDKKLFLSNLVTFIFLLISFLLLYHHLQAINLEYQYRNYKEQQNGFLIETGEEYEKLQVSKWLIILTSLNFILILNSLYYLSKNDYYKTFINKTAKKSIKLFGSD